MGDVAGYLAPWKPALGTAQAAAVFARAVAASEPGSQDLAKCLLWAASKLTSWAIPPIRVLSARTQHGLVRSASRGESGMPGQTVQAAVLQDDPESV